MKPALQSLPPVRRNGIFLLDHLAGVLQLSRRAAKHLLDERVVFVNGKRIWMAKHALQTRDGIEVLSSALPQAGGGTREKRAAAPRPKEAPVPGVLLEDSVLLVLDKPNGITSVGKDSLEEQLQVDHPAWRAVHRLDRDTSGCLIFAKTPEGRKALVEQFENMAVQKTYHALVAGIPEDTLFTIRLALDDLPAVSDVRVLSSQPRPPRASHVRVRIETGRTHQIRRHLQAAGHPVLGDRHYYNRASAAFRATPRQMLHAAVIRFTHPVTGKPVRLEAPLPADFRTMLRELRLK